MLTLRTWSLFALSVVLTLRVANAEPLPEGAIVRFGTPGRPAYDHTPILISPDGKILSSNTVSSPDGKLKAMISDAHGVHLISDYADSASRQLEGHTAYVAAVAFSPDGKLLASGSNDRTLRLWDIATEKQLHLCTGHQDQVCAVAFGPDGKTVASASWDGTVGIWDVGSGKVLHRVPGHRYEVLTVAFAPDGKSLASAGTDGMVRFLDPATGKELRKFTLSKLGVVALAFTKDGKEIVTADAAHTVQRWDAVTGREGRVEPQGKTKESSGKLDLLCSLHPRWQDGRPGRRGRLHSPVRLSDREGIAHRSTHPGYVWSLAFSPDGKTLASSARRHGVVRLWDVATGQMVRACPGHLGGVSRVLFSPDGKTLIAAGGSFDPKIMVYDTATAKEVRRLEGHTGYIEAIARTLDGRSLASASSDGTVRLWNLGTGLEQQRFPGVPPTNARIAFTSDGTGLLAPDAAGDLYVRDLVTGKERRRHGGLTQLRAVSPDGHTLAGTTDEDGVSLVEARSDQERRRFPVRAAWAVFSPDGRRLLLNAGDGTALLWDLAGAVKTDLAAREHDDVWRDLEGEAGRAYAAIWRLALSPKESVPLLRARLRPADAVDVAVVARRVAELDDDEFAVREKATKALEGLGGAARPALEKVVAASPSAEVRRRATALLDRLNTGLGTEDLRGLRALEVLEQIGTAESRQIVEGLTKGAPTAKLTQEAKALLQRWVTARRE